MLRKNYFLIVLFLISLGSILWLFSGFLKGALVAWLLVMVTQRFAANLEKYLSGSKVNFISSRTEIISAAILTLILLMVVFIPLIYLTSYAVASFDYQSIIGLKAKAISYFASLTWISAGVKAKIIAGVTGYLGDLTGGDHLKQILLLINGYIGNLSNGAFELGIVIIMFFLFHWYRKDITLFFIRLIPLGITHQRSIFKNVSGTLSIVFLTIFAVAVAQGIAFGLLMLFFDYNPLLFGFLAAISSVIPLFGTALIWVPVAINEVAHGSLLGGLVVAVYGSFVLAFLIDNFVRLFFLTKISTIVKVDYKINEFLLFFAIAAGIASFGFWGVLIGPALIALFVVLANSLNE